MQGHKALSREENLSNLVSILKTNAAAPRSKRLALRLLRRLLPSQTQQVMPRLIEFFLQEIGERLFVDASRKEPEQMVQIEPVEQMESEAEPPTPTQPTEQSMEEAEEEDEEGNDEEEDEEGEEDDEEFEPEEHSALYLNSWSLGLSVIPGTIHMVRSPKVDRSVPKYLRCRIFWTCFLGSTHN